MGAWLENAAVCVLCGTMIFAPGCMTRRTVRLDAQNPAVRVSVNGVLFGDTFVKPQEVPEILDDHGVPRSRVIHILLDSDVRNLGEARFLIGCLGRAGYTRPVLVTKRHAESVNLGKRKKTETPKMNSGRVRYKRAAE